MNQSASAPSGNGSIIFYISALLAGAFYAWFKVHYNAVITADSLWLTEAATRFLHGEKMSDSYFDANPPLSMLLYIPPALIAASGLATVYHAIFFYTLALLGFFSFLTYKLIRHIPGSDAITALIVASGLIIANTIQTSVSFTERDQILGMALVPFALTQLFMTCQWPLPRWLKHTTLVFGAVLILIKPHHGLLPTLILLHRAWTQKRISLWKDADFLYLAGAVIIYLAVCMTFFSDYVRNILVDAPYLYLADFKLKILARGGYYALIITIAMLSGMLLKRSSWIATFFFLCAIASLIPFVTQMWGFHYHLLPAISFFTCGLALLFRDSLLKIMNIRSAAFAGMLGLLVFSFVTRPLLSQFPTHESYLAMPLTKIVLECEKPCPFFILNDSIEITHQTAVYTGQTWASRFPSFWFLPGIYKPGSRLTDEQRLTYQKKYARMVVEDLARYKPKLVILGEFKITPEENVNWDQFLSVDDRFKSEWSHYTHTGQIELDQRIYFTGTKMDKPLPRTYQIYQRARE